MTRQAAIEEAERLFVREGFTYAQAAEATGIPESTLQKRGSAEEWGKRREHAQDYKATIKGLKIKLLDQVNVVLAKGGDPSQLIHSWRAVEAAYPEHRYDAKSDPKAALAIAVDTMRKLVEYLGEHDRNALPAIEKHIEPFIATLVDAANGSP